MKPGREDGERRGARPAERPSTFRLASREDRQAARYSSRPSCFAPSLLSRSTANEPLHRDKIDALKPGTSTATDVANTLGAPNRLVQLASTRGHDAFLTETKALGQIVEIAVATTIAS